MYNILLTPKPKNIDIRLQPLPKHYRCNFSSIECNLQLFNLILKSRELNDDAYIEKYVNNNKDELEEIELINGIYYTPLMFACELSTLNIVKILLDCGANVNKQNYVGHGAFACACLYSQSSSSIEIVKLLIEYGVNINITNFQNSNVLHELCTKITENTLEMVEFLIELGVDMYLLNDYGDSPLYFACRRCKSYMDHEKLVKIFIDSNINLSKTALICEDSVISGFEVICCNMNDDFIKYCFTKHNYYNEEVLLKCIQKSKNYKLLLPYLEKLYYDKIGYS